MSHVRLVRCKTIERNEWLNHNSYYDDNNNNNNSLLSVRLELPVADSIKQHHVYSVRTIKIFPYVTIWFINNKNNSNFIHYTYFQMIDYSAFDMYNKK